MPFYKFKSVVIAEQYNSERWQDFDQFVKELGGHLILSEKGVKVIIQGGAHLSTLASGHWLVKNNNNFSVFDNATFESLYTNI
jgi:midasin (ATPase involved in ribosome maturation)